jgi:hypothetical protein
MLVAKCSRADYEPLTRYRHSARRGFLFAEVLKQPMSRIYQRVTSVAWSSERFRQLTAPGLASSMAFHGVRCFLLMDC